MKHREAAHAWAHDNYNRNGEIAGSRIFATQHNRTIYSYGTHFPIARRTNSPAFPVLFTSRGYSVSTSKHIGYVRNAVSHLSLFYCENPADGEAAILRAGWQELVRNGMPALESARRDVVAMQTRISARAAKGLPVSDFLSRRLEELEGRVAGKSVSIAERIAELERFRGAFSLSHKDYGKETDKLRRTFKGSDLAKVSDKLAARAAKDKRAAEKARKAYEAEQLKAAAERMEQWLAGESVSPPYYGGPARLRVMGDRVETSQGARVTCKAALSLFAIAARCRESGKEWTCPPETPVDVNGYPLTSITAAGDVTIGCHTLEFAEMARIEPATRAAIA